MHAVMVKVSVEPSRQEESLEWLKANVLPLVKQSPGLIAGYWVSPGGPGHGLSLLLFESEEAARAAASMASNGPRPDYATIESVDVLGVDASI